MLAQLAFSLARFTADLLTVLLFAGHLLAVNVAMAAPLLCIWLDVKSRRDPSTPAGEIQRRLAEWSLGSLAAGVALGGLLLGMFWFKGERNYWTALGMIPHSRLGFAAGELVFYFVLMAVYRWLAGKAPRWAWLGRLLAVASAANLLLHFPPLFAMVEVISHRPELWSDKLDRTLYHSLFVDREVVSRVAHVWLASFATAGIWVMWLAERRAKAIQATDDGSEAAAAGFGALVAGGARWALFASLAQIPLGVWLLMVTPTRGGGDWTGDGAGLLLVGVGVLAALRLMHVLGAAAMGSRRDRPRGRSALMLLTATVLLMAAASQYFRHAAEPIAEPIAGIEEIQR